MLTHLNIQNYALIESLDIDFRAGLSVVTGETGAGKSIMIGALTLLLGQRADTRVIQQGKKKCVVEAVFDVSGMGLRSLFADVAVDYDDECIIRREVLDSGKSRAFVNDTPVNLQQLRMVASRLVDIHSQHENLLLGEASFQLDVLDAVADAKLELSDYQQKYKEYKRIEAAWRALVDTAEKWRADRDYAQFQFDQLAALQLVDGEQEALETEQNAMSHSEEVKTALALALARLTDDVGVNQQLNETVSALRRISGVAPHMVDYEQRVESVLIELKDVAADLEMRLNDTDFDPQRRQFVDERLDQIYTMQQKHRVASVADLLSLQAEFEAKLARIDGFDDEIKLLDNQKIMAEKQLREAAEKLSKKRRLAIGDFEREVSLQLTGLGMPNANFVVCMQPASGFQPHGVDVIEFRFSANKNHTPQALAHAASGGEMSRLMLVIKALVASRAQLPTVILDEIDTGVSGEVAHRMGLIMRQMAQSMQVIAITHLPQIAAKGVAHYKVYKRDTTDTTVTEILYLTEDQRIMELAEMLSGKNPPAAAVANAKELLNN